MGSISKNIIASLCFAGIIAGCAGADPSPNEGDDSAAALSSCRSVTFVGGTVSPIDVAPGGKYTITCDYGSANNATAAVPGSGTCAFAGFKGNAAQFSCVAGQTAGTFANACRLANYSPSYFCAQTDRIASLTVGSGTTTASSPPPASSATPPTDGVNIGAFGSAGNGADDTAVFTTAMKGAVAQNKTLVVTAGSYKLGAITPPANLRMYLAPNVCVNQVGTFSTSQAWINLTNSNITITGNGGAARCDASSSVFMATTSYNQSKSDGSEWRHCLRITGSSIKVDGIGCDNSGGDGLYIGNPATNITVSNSVFDHHIRNGGSGVAGQHVTISGSTFSNQRDFTLIGIADGFDFEPNVPTDLLIDWNLSNNTMIGNQFDGVGFSLFHLTDATKTTTITLNNNASDDNDRYGYFVSNAGTTNSKGTITCNGCRADNNGNANVIARFWASNGPSLTFKGFTSTNNNRLGGDVYGIIAGVAIGGGGGDSVASGNVHFFNTNVSGVRGGHYFDFRDNSGHGLASVDFTAGNLSGGVAGCNGLVMGQCMSSVSIP